MTDLMMARIIEQAVPMIPAPTNIPPAFVDPNALAVVPAKIKITEDIRHICAGVKAVNTFFAAIEPLSSRFLAVASVRSTTPRHSKKPMIGIENSFGIRGNRSAMTIMNSGFPHSTIKPVISSALKLLFFILSSPFPVPSLITV